VRWLVGLVRGGQGSCSLDTSTGPGTGCTRTAQQVIRADCFACSLRSSLAAEGTSIARPLFQLLISGLQLLAGPGRSERAAAGAPADALMLSVR
jgi:hypothetical protein